MKGGIKLVLAVGGAGGAVVGGLFLYALYDGPRMKVQPHLRAYQAVMPMPPPGSVAATPSPYVPAGTPAPATPETGGAARGAVYYGYYCLFCHGGAGRGDGPVGESYLPTPADLTSARVRDLAPEKLQRRMLTGAGHSPVLERVVRPGHRADLVRYVTSLGSGKGERRQE